MTVFLSERLRYGAYALMAAAAVAAYFWLSSDPDQTAIEAARKAIPSEDLPILHALDTEVEQDARRDLFAFGGGAPGVEMTPPAAIMPDQPAIERPDLLASVQPMGVVRTNESITILVRVGNRLMTVGLGEPFGDGEALRVDSIQGRNVLIVDRTSGTSRNFRLSEE